MEATFDNQTNLLSCNIRSSVDNSIIYTITTSHNLWGRTVTLLKDANPALGDSPIVGAIYWRERLFEVHGHRKSISDIKCKPPGFTRGHPHPHAPRAAKAQHRRTQSQVTQRSRHSNRDRSGKGEDGQGKRRERVREDNSESRSAPLCTSCWSIARRSSAILGQFGLGDWWRSLTCSARHWQWAADRTEYELTYHHEQWQVCYHSLHIHHHLPISRFFIEDLLISFPVALDIGC